MKMIVLITKDLFFVPVIRSAAAQHSVELLTGGSCDDSRLAGLADADVGEQVVSCMVDLSAVSVTELPEIAGRIRDLAPRATCVAFGPHVQKPRLDAAREAGFDAVFSRGQIDAQIASLVGQWKQAFDSSGK